MARTLCCVFVALFALSGEQQSAVKARLRLSDNAHPPVSINLCCLQLAPELLLPRLKREGTCCKLHRLQLGEALQHLERLRAALQLLLLQVGPFWPFNARVSQAQGLIPK